eukprot:TRINITY_DN6330_c0_g1_i2.p1 TRINITY_DN6330_c0_g1~~TRINITY_DN6330_c0_g1_i2.p1  ORF type:complete len:443 (-),score=95.77 TRINITY_DN6330_c0_g1_i2:119-1447(-)
MATPTYSRLLEDQDNDVPTFSIASNEHRSTAPTPSAHDAQRLHTHSYDPYGDMEMDGEYPMLPLGNSAAMPPQQFIPQQQHQHQPQQQFIPQQQQQHQPQHQFIPSQQHQQQFIPNHGPNADPTHFTHAQSPPHSEPPQPPHALPNLGDLTGMEFEHYIHQRQYRLDVSHLLQEAWRAYKNNYVQLISYMFFVFVIIILIAICMVVIIFTQMDYQAEYYSNESTVALFSESMLSSMANLFSSRNQLWKPYISQLITKQGYTFSKSEDAYPDEEEEPIFSTSALVGLLVLQLILLSVIPAMIAGLYTGLFHYIRGEQIKFGHLLLAFRRIGAIFTIEVISVILNEIHFIAGFYGALCLAYAIPLCLEREELGFFTSVSLSFRMAHRDIANNIILSLVSYCMLTIGTLLFFISYPMAYFMYGFAYLHIFGLQGVVIAVSQHQAA